MDRFTYPATLTPASAWEPTETGFVVDLPDFPEAYTQGETVEEALAAAADCLRVVVEGRMRDGTELPPPTTTLEGAHPVAIPPLLAAKAALYQSMREQGVSNATLAERLSCGKKEVRGCSTRATRPGCRGSIRRCALWVGASWSTCATRRDDGR